MQPWDNTFFSNSSTNVHLKEGGLGVSPATIRSPLQTSQLRVAKGSVIDVIIRTCGCTAGAAFTSTLGKGKVGGVTEEVT